MHQRIILRQMRIAAGIAAIALALGATAAAAQDPAKCRRAVVKNGQKYSSTVGKALQKCEEGRLKGKITTPCAADAKTQDKIGKAASKLAAGIDKACAGVALADMGFAGQVDRCAGGDRDGERCVDSFDCPDGGTCTPVDECPTFLNGRLPGDDACEIALGTPASVAECLECAANAKVGAVIDAFYGPLAALSADKAVQKCQIDIGKRTAKYFDAVEKALAKCEDALLNGKVPSCPDAKTSDKIAKSLSKLEAAIAKTCASGATISHATSAGKVFGAAPIFGACGVTGTQTSAGLAANLACLAEGAAACDVALSTGSNACSTGLCGNGQIDEGETCDDGNTARDSGAGPDDICPPDCSVAACAISGTQAVDISFQAPVDLIGLTVLLSYDDEKVSIPAVGNDPPVLNAVASGVFATSPRDSDTSLRINLEDPTVIGVAPGVAATVTFNRCGAATVSAADFGCMVVDATNTAFEAIAGVTCTVSVP